MPPNREDVETEPAMGAITDRQLLVDAVQKLGVLTSTVKEGFEASASRDLDLAHRVTGLEAWRRDVDDRMSRNSERAEQPSKHDLEAQAALAAEIAAREALAAKVVAIDDKINGLDAKQDVQTAIMQRIEDRAVTWWSSPSGKIARAIVYAAAIGWLAGHNVHVPGLNQ